jgi:protein-tyrosine kinase
MERIKEAVEIAKADRLQLGGRVSPKGPGPREQSSGLRARDFGVSGDGELTRFNREHLKSMRIVSDDASDPRGRGFEMLRSEVFRKMKENSFQTIGITSPTAGCGKTVCALNLAFSMARLPERSVTLVDLDLRKPLVANYLGLPPGPGLDDVLRTGSPIEDIIIVPEISNGRMRILPAYRPSPQAAEHIASSRLSELVQVLKGQDPQGAILFDLPPVLAVDDVISFLPNLDCVLLIVASGQTTVSDISNSERLLGVKRLMGIVLNKSEEEMEIGYGY